jgi:hypothetical protein
VTDTLTTILTARRVKRVASLAIAETAYDAALAKRSESYNFNSGEGSQAATRRKLKDLKDQIDMLTAEIEEIDRRLNGRDVHGFAMPRFL